MATVSFFGTNCSYIAHAAFTVSPDPYPNGIPCPAFQVQNISTGTKITIYASEVTPASGYDFPVDVYVNDVYVDYLQSTSVSFYPSDGMVVRLVATKKDTPTTNTYYGRLRLYANGGNFYGTTSSYIDWPTSGEVSGTGTSGALVSITLPVSTGNFVPYRAGYTFVGWATSSAATSATYISGEDVSFTAKSTSSSSPTTVSLYAVWKQTFTLTYATSYSGVTNMPSAVTGLTSGSGVIVSSTIPEKLGYRFVGWARSDGGEATLFAGSNVYITADTTLWTVFEKNTISLFFWNGSDTNDATLIAKGKEVKTAITATRWNNLLAKIKELADACGVSFSYTPVSSGNGITAARFNAARTGLANIKTALGTATVLPAAQSKGNTMYATLFTGNGSIKGALNHMIGVYNNR